ncbi:MAG: hypothetical protein HOK35_11385 [Cytophagia bacterium]|nr:hypothetical protein [Cytophagia bacterium]
MNKNINFIRFTATFATLSLLLISCAPSTPWIIRLTPVSDSTNWDSGVEYISLKVDSLDFKIGVGGMVNGRYMIDFTLINNSPTSITVLPESFFYIGTSQVGANSIQETIMAIDPEKEIQELTDGRNFQIAEYKKKKKEQAALGLIGATLAIASGSPIEDDDSGHRALSKREQNIKAYGELIQTWQETVVRKHTLNAADTLAGIVFFPYSNSATIVEFHFPVEDNIPVFKFSQTNSRNQNNY